MAIDPMMYQKLSGRKGDPYTRMGEVLAKDAKHKQEPLMLPKGGGRVQDRGHAGHLLRICFSGRSPRAGTSSRDSACRAKARELPRGE